MSLYKEISKFDFFLLFIAMILAFIPVIIITLTFTGILTKITEVDPEVINGLLTVSGVIFAFQSAYFRKPKKPFHQIFFTVIFVVEIILLGLSGYSYVKDISELGNPSTYTLFIAFGSLTYNISITGFFVVYDLFVLSSQRMEE